AAQVPVVVVSQRPARTVEPLAIGLFVAGAGRTVTRADAIAAIERGTVENAVLGGRPTGKRKIRLVFSVPRNRTSAIIYVVLPPPGRHTNDRRYAIFVVGVGNGILTSSSTRIPGLVAVTDIVGEARALAEHRGGPLRATPGHDADLLRLDRRLARAHEYRTG